MAATTDSAIEGTAEDSAEAKAASADCADLPVDVAADVEATEQVSLETLESLPGDQPVWLNTKTGLVLLSRAAVDEHNNEADFVEVSAEEALQALRATASESQAFVPSKTELEGECVDSSPGAIEAKAEDSAEAKAALADCADPPVDVGATIEAIERVPVETLESLPDDQSQAIVPSKTELERKRLESSLRDAAKSLSQALPVEVYKEALDLLASEPDIAANHAGAIVQRLNDENKSVKRLVLGTLSMLSEDACQPFVDTIAHVGLSDDDANLRLQSLKVLQGMPNAAVPAIGRIADCLCDSDVWVRGGALTALRNMPEAAAPCVVGRLGHAESTVRWRALRVLRDMPEAAAPYIAEIHERQRDIDKQVRELARDLIRTIPGVVIAKLADPDVEVRTRTLGIFQRAPPAAARFITQVIDRIVDEHVYCRAQAQELLNLNILATATVSAHLSQHLAHAEEDVRLRVLDVMSRLPEDVLGGHAAELVPLLKRPSPEIKQWTIYTLSCCVPAAAAFAKEIVELVRDEAEEVWSRTMELLEEMPDAAAPPLAARLKADSSSDERERILRVLSTMPEAAAPFQEEEIMECATDASKTVRTLCRLLVTKIAELA